MDIAYIYGHKNVLGKAKTGGGMFLSRLRKIGRSSSNSEKEVSDSDYKLKVIILPYDEPSRGGGVVGARGRRFRALKLVSDRVF